MSHRTFFYLKEMTFGKVLEAFKSRFPGIDGGKELYLTDKKAGGWRYLSFINRARGPYWGILVRGRDRTDRAQRGLYKNDRGPIFPSTARAS